MLLTRLAENRWNRDWREESLAVILWANSIDMPRVIIAFGFASADVTIPLAPSSIMSSSSSASVRLREGTVTLKIVEGFSLPIAPRKWNSEALEIALASLGFRFGN